MNRDIGRRLRALRQEAGLTQQQLAAPVYTHAYVSTIEAGRRSPSRAAIEHFAAKLGVTPGELETGRPKGLEEGLRLRLNEARTNVSLGHVTAARQAYDEVRAAAEANGLPLVAATALEGSARCFEQEGRLDAAAEVFEAAEMLLQGIPAVAITGARCGRARCIAQKGDRRYAIYLLETLLDRLRATPSPDALVYTHATLIPIYFRVGAFAAAKRSADEALRLAKRVEDPYVLATMHVQVARVLLGSGHPELAREALKEAEGMFRAQDLETELGMAHLALGYTARQEGRKREARTELRKAHDIFERTGRRIEQARASNELARLLREAGDVDAARDLVERATHLLDAGSDASELALSHRELGLCYAVSEPELAEKNLATAINLFELAEDTVEMAVTHRHLGHVLRLMGRRTEACDTFEAGLRVLEARS